MDHKSVLEEGYVLFEEWGAPVLERIDGHTDENGWMLTLTIRWEDRLFSVTSEPMMFDADKPFLRPSRGSGFVWMPDAEEVPKTFDELKVAVNKLAEGAFYEPYIDDLPRGRFLIDGELNAAQLHLLIAWLAQQNGGKDK